MCILTTPLCFKLVCQQHLENSPLKTPKTFERGLQILKKIIPPLLSALCILIFLPIILLIAIIFLIHTPFDYIKYRRTRYYKDTKEKYRWLAGMTNFICLYDAIREADLPIQYHTCTDGCEYLLYKNILILNEYAPCYDSDRNILTVEIEDEYVNIEDAVAKDIEDCNESMQADICRRALVLVDNDELSEHEPIELANCTIVPIGDEGIAETLRKYIDHIA